MEGKEVREGSSRKRAAILAAAQALFLSHGFARTKMDAVALRAGVSKRTVYDYYGDKQTLFSAVVERVIHALESAVQSAIADNLTNVVDVEASLVNFAKSITTSALGSSEYADLTRLLAVESADLPDTQVLWSAAEPEEALATCFADLDGRGLMDSPNPRRAADHFVALTLSLSTPQPSLRRAVALNDTETEAMIVDGVRAFLRAYGPGQRHSR